MDALTKPTAIAGVSSPMLLRNFGSRAGLFEAALIDAVRLSPNGWARPTQAPGRPNGLHNAAGDR